MHDLHGSGVLDFVTAWYVKAARYLKENQAQAYMQQAMEAMNSGIHRASVAPPPAGLGWPAGAHEPSVFEIAPADHPNPASAPAAAHQANGGQNPIPNPSSAQANEGRISISNSASMQVAGDQNRISSLTTAQVAVERSPISNSTTAQVNEGRIPISPHSASQGDSAPAKLGSDPHWPDHACLT